MSYEVWDKAKLGQRKALPDKTSYTIDSAMETAKVLSRGSTKKRVYNPKKKDPNSYVGGYDEVDIPNAFAVIDRGDKESRVRGWGINGVWFDARDCKRCANTGNDPTFYGDVCSSCKGSSYKPKT